MYPIAMGAVDQTGASRLNMAFMVMLSASDYMTSFGYQTNLMVYAPGGYQNTDYLKFGTPLQVILWLTSTALVSTSSTWYISWVICILLFLVASATRLTNITNFCMKKKGKAKSEDSGNEYGDEDMLLDQVGDDVSV